MSAHDRLPFLIRRIYTAAADERCWPEVLEDLADAYGGGVAGLQYRTGEGLVRFARFVRVDPAILRLILSQYADGNPWVKASQAVHATGLVIDIEDIVPLANLRRTDYYADVVQPLDVLHCMAGCVFRQEDHVISFTIVRSSAAGPWTAGGLAEVAPLLPHLRRAMQINARLSHLDRTEAALADGLEQLRHGVFIVDRAGRVIFANRAGRTIVAAHDGLTIDADGLKASAYRDRLKLRSLIDDAVRTSAGEGFSAGGVLPVARPSQKAPYLLLVAPLPLAAAGDDPSPGLVTVLVSDPETSQQTPDDVVRRAYNLTAAETRVAQALVATGTSRRAAERLGITRETLRWHLKRIYRKTGTSRQAALVRRLVDTAPPLALDQAPPTYE